MSLHTDKTGAVTIGKERHLVALEATWEIAALCGALVQVDIPEDEDGAHLVIRGLAARVQCLSRAVGEALGDEVCTTVSLRKEVCRTTIQEERERQA